MKRRIAGFLQDQQDSWVAELDCYHAINYCASPFLKSTFSESIEVREQALNEAVNCIHCDTLEFPEGLTAYKKTPEFTETTIPKGLLNNHTTKLGTWGLIHVLDGSLIYIHEQEGINPIEILAGETAAVPPCMPHRVRANDKVRFFVEFCKKEL